jgi:hypothetical protein
MLDGPATGGMMSVDEWVERFFSERVWPVERDMVAMQKSR